MEVITMKKNITLIAPLLFSLSAFIFMPIQANYWDDFKAFFGITTQSQPVIAAAKTVATEAPSAASTIATKSLSRFLPSFSAKNSLIGAGSMLTLSTIYLGYKYYHYKKELDAIASIIDKSSRIASNKDKDFRFGACIRLGKPQSPYATHQQILKDQTKIAEILKSTNRYFDETHPNDSNRDLSKLNDDLKKEKEELSIQIKTVSSYIGSLPKKLIHEINNPSLGSSRAIQLAFNNQYCSDIDAFIETLDCNWKTLTAEELVTAFNTAAQSYLKSPSIYYPCNWQRLPFYAKASGLFYELVIRYCRICALECVVNNKIARKI